MDLWDLGPAGPLVIDTVLHGLVFERRWDDGNIAQFLGRALVVGN